MEGGRRGILNNEDVFYDENGDPYVIVQPSGERIPPPQINRIEHKGFRTYDTNQGHCALCGRLTCRGTCFK
jgi:hypothetical protein